MTENLDDCPTNVASHNVTNSEASNPDEPTTGGDNPFKSEKEAPKRKKLKKLAESAEAAENGEENGNVMPTAPPSKRQKKRQKKIQKHVRDKDQDIERSISYLNKWDNNRDEWKYEKLRQIFIQKNIFDENAIPDKHSEVAIRYLSTSKGHARAIIIKTAEDVMKEIEDALTEENQEELTSSSRYKRARELMQTMQE